jgi:hypothetical protein
LHLAHAIGLGEDGEGAAAGVKDGAPIFLPVRSAALVMPDFLSAITEAGVVL